MAIALPGKRSKRTHSKGKPSGIWILAIIVLAAAISLGTYFYAIAPSSASEPTYTKIAAQPSGQLTANQQQAVPPADTAPVLTATEQADLLKRVLAKKAFMICTQPQCMKNAKAYSGVSRVPKKRALARRNAVEEMKLALTHTVAQKHLLDRTPGLQTRIDSWRQEQGNWSVRTITPVNTQTRELRPGDKDSVTYEVKTNGPIAYSGRVTVDFKVEETELVPTNVVW